MTTAEAPKTYNPRSVPPNPNGSRFAVNRTPDGWPVSEETECLAIVAEKLLQELRENTPQALPETVTVSLLFPALVDQEYRLVNRGELTRVPELKPARPTKIGQTKLKGARLLDSFLLGEPEGYGKATDKDVFQALLDYVTEARPSQAAVRRLSDAIAVGVLQRAGIAARKDELPLPSNLLDPRHSR